MDIVKWIMIGCLIAILAPLFGISFVYLFARIVLGKEPEESLPTDGNKITHGMLDSKADLQALIDGAEMFRKKKEMGA